MKKRLMTTLATGALVGTMMAGGAVSALAGEVNGKGEPTPVQSYRAASICSFSGLNDDPYSTDPHDPPGRVQSYGFSVVKNGLMAVVPDRPGVNCRGNGGGH